MRRAVFVGAILAVGSAGANGTTSGLAPGWLAAEGAGEAQAMERVAGGQSAGMLVVILQAMCFHCTLDVTLRNGIDWPALHRCVFICNMAF